MLSPTLGHHTGYEIINALHWKTFGKTVSRPTGLGQETAHTSNRTAERPSERLSRDLLVLGRRERTTVTGLLKDFRKYCLETYWPWTGNSAH
jgi:hypothetical protein